MILQLPQPHAKPTKSPPKKALGAGVSTLAGSEEGPRHKSSPKTGDCVIHSVWSSSLRQLLPDPVEKGLQIVRHLRLGMNDIENDIDGTLLMVSAVLGISMIFVVVVLL